jgi:hypothetical protein
MHPSNRAGRRGFLREDRTGLLRRADHQSGQLPAAVVRGALQLRSAGCVGVCPV